jgi:DNA-binding NtrC family response regulator
MDEHRHSVMVVEDDRSTREALEALLTTHGYGVITVEDAERGLDAADQNPDCCLILLDWRMRGLGGEGFLRRRQHVPSLAGLPVVVLSGQELSGADAKAAGACAFLRKPMDPTILLGILEHQCRAHSGGGA